MILGKYSMGVGDRFGCQGQAQLDAFVRAKQEGIDVVPVWNKSYREHSIVHSQPKSVRAEADAAVQSLGWSDSYFVDADHIGLKTVDGFVAASDFFTLDVADWIGQEPDASELTAFVGKYTRFVGALSIPGLDDDLTIEKDQIVAIGRTYLQAVKEAGRIYRHIAQAKGEESFVTEVSMDETATPQTPLELLFILAAISDESIPAQTIAPRFSGRFNKGVDYVGDVDQFHREFEADLAVIRFAVHEFGLPSNLKLSLHSGSDKFSIYGPINRAMAKFDAGLHLKTAGTTWLEELIGLAAAGGDGLSLAKEVYRIAFSRFDELCTPYAEVIDIDASALPDPRTVDEWDSGKFTSVLRHDLSNPDYNLNVRQLLHVGYKVAAEMGTRYLDALAAHHASVSENVTTNILERHLKRVFGSDKG